MKNFLKEKKIIFVVIIGILIASGAIYFSGKRINRDKEETSKVFKEVCPNTPQLPNNSVKLVTKVIDGDTFLIEGGYSVRILGIDADERGYPCYQVAKDKLEELILNKEVRLEKGKRDKDQWCRYLRYVFLSSSGEDVGLELVKEGLAVARFSEEEVKYREEISQAEKIARENKIGCKWSGLPKKNQETKNKTKNKKLSWQRLIPEITGLRVVDACQAGNYYGEEMIVEGKIVDAYRSRTQTVFLNFEKAYPNQCFTGVIFNSDQDKFGEKPEEYYLGKVVRIKGKIKEYQGKPEIILKDPVQIEIGK